MSHGVTNIKPGQGQHITQCSLSYTASVWLSRVRSVLPWHIRDKCFRSHRSWSWSGPHLHTQHCSEPRDSTLSTTRAADTASSHCTAWTHTHTHTETSLRLGHWCLSIVFPSNSPPHLSSRPWPTQIRPPWRGEGLLQDRCLTSKPMPHVLLH